MFTSPPVTAIILSRIQSKFSRKLEKRGSSAFIPLHSVQHGSNPTLDAKRIREEFKEFFCHRRSCPLAMGALHVRRMNFRTIIKIV